MGVVLHLFYAEMRKRAYLKGAICRLDYGVFLMSPLRYAVLMFLPLMISTFLMYRHEFSYSFVLRYGSWKNLLFRQLKKSAGISFLYAVFLIGWVCLTERRLPVYNWDIQGSYYFFQTHSILLLHPAEVVLYVCLMCVIRNVIIINILLFSLWQNSFLQGVVFLCVINCFEIVQKKYRIFYWLISPDYTVWTNQNSRIEMFAITGIYFLIGYLLFRHCINKKELAGHGKT